MLTENHIREGLSRAFILAVAHRAGFNCSLNREFDYGVDGELLDIKLREGRHIETGFSIQFQAKASGNWEIHGSHVLYDLEAKNYNDLVDTERPFSKPFILILFAMPPEPNDWLTVTSDALLLRNSAWWMSLRGQGKTDNSASKRIRIPKANVFDVAAAHNLMNRTKSGEEF